MNIPFKKKSYAGIIAPLTKMMNELKAYAKEQVARINNLNIQKTKIDNEIYVANDEISKSNTSIEQLDKIIVTK